MLVAQQGPDEATPSSDSSVLPIGDTQYNGMFFRITRLLRFFKSTSKSMTHCI